MNITDEELGKLLDNPMHMQYLILNELENGESKTIRNATSPFMLLMESAVTLSSAVATECKNKIRKTYPSLAGTMEDLWHHLDDSEIPGLFATPAETNLKFHIYVFDMKNIGYRPEGQNYFECTIPYGTVVTALGIKFTILNSIVVRIYDTVETSYVEMIPNPDVLSNTSITMLESKIMHDTNQQPYITFTVPVKQLHTQTFTQSLSSSSRTKYSFNLEGKFIKADITCKFGNDAEFPVPICLSDEYLNPNKPQVQIGVSGNTLTVTVPSMYVISGKLRGTLYIKAYVCNGESYLPLDKYTDEDFNFTLGPATNPSEQVMKDIRVIVKGASDLIGGSNGKTFQEIKDSIIYKTTGIIDVPVTNYQIVQRGADKGYNISKIEDTLNTRLFTASKPMPSFNSTVIQCIPDTYNNTVGIKLDELKSYYPTLVRDNDFIIKSGCIFKEENSKLRILSPDEVQNIINMPRTTKVQHFKENKYYYNFFTYAIRVKDGTTEANVYHLDYPKITNIRHIGKNQNVVNVLANINKYSIKKVDKGYMIYFNVDGNDTFKNIDKTAKFVQIAFTTTNGSVVYYNSSYDDVNDMYSMFIEVDDFITTDGYIELLNAKGPDGTKLVSLDTDMMVNIYITDPKFLDKSKYLRDCVFDPDPNISVLTNDRLSLFFGKEISFLWNKLYNTYTDRKYKTYKEDKLKFYTEDVYKIGPDGNIVFEVNDDSTKLSVVKLHNKGDVVKDEQGNDVYEYRAGDVVMQNGEPVIDDLSGVIRYIDILMLEYEFKAASASAQEQLNKLVVKYLESMLLEELPVLNRSLLERTKILFKSAKSALPVTIKANNVTYKSFYRISPKIVLYVDQSTNISLTDLESYKFKIGNIINSELNREIIDIPRMAEKIKNGLIIGVRAVKITGILPEDSQMGAILSANKLTLNKCLTIAEYKETIITYDIDLEIEKVQ